MHDRVARVVLRVHVHSVLAAEFEHPVLTFAQPCAADGGHGAVSSLTVPHASARAVSRLEE